MTVYPSRVSISILIFIFLMNVYTGYQVYLSGEIVPLIISAVIFLFVLAVFLTIRYYIDPETKTLKIKVCGLPSGTIDLTQVKEIRKSHSIFSAPAASLSRICLDIKGGPDVLLSPRYQQDFLEEVRKINPDVKIDERLLAQ